jgi:hypothetical protein
MELKVQRLHELEGKGDPADFDIDIDDEPYASIEIGGGTSEHDPRDKRLAKAHNLVDKAADGIKDVWADELDGLEAGGVEGFDSWMDQIDRAAELADQQMMNVVDRTDDRLHAGRFNDALMKARKAKYDKERYAKKKAARPAAQ